MIPNKLSPEENERINRKLGIDSRSTSYFRQGTLVESELAPENDYIVSLNELNMDVGSIFVPMEKISKFEVSSTKVEDYSEAKKS